MLHEQEPPAYGRGLFFRVPGPCDQFMEKPGSPGHNAAYATQKRAQATGAYHAYHAYHAKAA